MVRDQNLLSASQTRLPTPSPQIGLVVAAHAPLASGLLQTARSVMGDRFDAVGEQVCAVDIDATNAAADAFSQMTDAIASVDAGRGVLVVADLFGGSAANLALAQLGSGQVEVVTGVNLPMLLGALSARATAPSLEALASKVASVAHGSVVVAGALLAGTPAPEQDPAQAA